MPGPEGDKAREGEGEGGRELLFSRRQLAACLVVVFAPRPHLFPVSSLFQFFGFSFRIKFFFFLVL